jgi:hypothetical protein
MMSCDSSHVHEGEEGDGVVCTGCLRALPPISLANTFKSSMQHRGALDKKLLKRWRRYYRGILLVEYYRGKLLCDDGSDDHYCTFCVVTEVNLVEWTKHQHWSATSPPVEKKSGHWVVRASSIAGGGSLVRAFTITARCKCKLLP